MATNYNSPGAGDSLFPKFGVSAAGCSETYDDNVTHHAYRV